MSIFQELQRRNVFRVGAAYIVTAWLVIQVVETLFPVFDLSNQSIRIVVVILAIGLVPVLLFAWAFELTPEGLKREREVDRSRSIASRTGKKLDRWVIVVLAVALAYFAVDKFVLDPARDSSREAAARQEARSEALVESYGDRSIVVLPFADLSPEGDQEYFSEGLAEELLNLLAKIPELRVISRTSAFSFKDSNTPVSEIARLLNVQNVLEGSVRKAGDRLRVTVQLIDARADTHLWSETYYETQSDVFAVQEAIAGAVAERLHIALVGNPIEQEAIDPEAYSLYLQGRHVRRNQRDAEGTLRAEQLLLEALAIEPDYVDALYELDSVYFGQREAGARSTNEVEELSQGVIDRIQEVDPGNPLVILRRLWTLWDEGRFQEYAESLAELFNSRRDHEVEFRVYNFLKYLGRYDDAIVLMQSWRSTDPVGCASYINLADLMRFTGEPDKLLEYSEKALSLCPGLPASRHMRTTAQLQLGRTAEAVEEAEQEVNPLYRLNALVIAHYAAGNQELSDRYLEELKNYGEGNEVVEMVAIAYAWRDEADAAFEWLRRLEDYFPPGNDPLFQPFADDPRWAALVDTYGQTPEEMANLEYDIHLPN